MRGGQRTLQRPARFPRGAFSDYLFANEKFLAGETGAVLLFVV
jgi:hypothetical protein